MTGKRRCVRASRALTALVILCLYPPAAWPQTPPSPSDGSSLQGWKVEHTSAEVIDGVLRVGKGNGWVRTERVYADFVLSFDVRVPADRAVTDLPARVADIRSLPQANECLWTDDHRAQRFTNSGTACPSILTGQNV